MNEIILNKKISIERCIKQIQEYDACDRGLPFEKDYFKQDAIGMNLQRASELVIDIANHLIKSKKLGLPQGSRDTFALLHRADVITKKMMKHLQGMVGFRNILIHEYRALNLSVMRDVIDFHIQELIEFANIALNAVDDR